MATPSNSHDNWYEPPTYPGGDQSEDKYKDQVNVNWCALTGAATTRSWARTKKCYVKKPGSTDTDIAGADWSSKTTHLHEITCPAPGANAAAYGATLPVYRSDTGVNLNYTKPAASIELSASTTKTQCDAVMNITDWAAGTDTGTAAKAAAST